MNSDQEKLNKMDIYPHNIEEVMIEYRKSLEQAKFGMCGDSIQCNFFKYYNFCRYIYLTIRYYS